MKDVGGNGGGTSHGIMFMVAPMERRYGTFEWRRHLFACGVAMCLDVGAKYLAWRHTDTQDDSQVAIIGERKIFANFNTDSTAHLCCFVTTTTRHKVCLSLLIK